MTDVINCVKGNSAAPENHEKNHFLFNFDRIGWGWGWVWGVNLISSPSLLSMYSSARTIFFLL